MTTNPTHGTREAYVQPGSNGKSVVVVKAFKFDSIRQESYWVTKEVRVFANTANAQAYAERIVK